MRVPMLISSREEISMLPERSSKPIPVPPDGPVTFYVLGDVAFPRVPMGTVIHGQLFRGKERVYAWLTELVMPDGKRFPICGNIVRNENREGIGVPYAKGSTPERPLMSPRVDLATSPYFGWAE